MKKLAVLGGSFNPVHLGHLAVADAVLTNLDYDRVIFVPAFESPFKQGAEGGSPHDRFDMLLSSIGADTHLTLDDCEIRRKGVSYTIDTIADIRRRYCPDGKIGLVIGDDLAPDFLTWKDSAAILEQSDVIIAHRLSVQIGVLPYPYRTINNDIVAVSSALIRERIRNGSGWRHIVPYGVARIIEERELYGYATADWYREIVRMEEAVRPLLSSARFLHSRNTALLSYDLCAAFGIDPRKGYLTGLVHDICKSFPDGELLSLAKKDGCIISKLERKKTSLLHARAGAVLLKERFDIQDEAVLEAVRFHTTGRENMGMLAKIVFVADKIEVSRPGMNPAIREYCRDVLQHGSGFDTLFSMVLGDTVDFLRSNEEDISASTLRLLGSMRKRGTG
jgi:nicotinate-nucleotide adenylyltransferase